MTNLFDEPVADRITPAELLQIWNDAAAAAGMRGARELGSTRARRLTKLLDDKPSRAYWRDVVDRIAASGFCTGKIANRGGRSWRADFDFLTRYDTHIKVLEGKYDDAEFGHAHKAANRGRAVVYDDTIHTLPMRRHTGGH